MASDFEQKSSIDWAARWLVLARTSAQNAKVRERVAAILARFPEAHALGEAAVPSLNKQSLREEFEELRGCFEQLCAQGKMAAESRAAAAGEGVLAEEHRSRRWSSQAR
jgi:hypothetical protein